MTYKIYSPIHPKSEEQQSANNWEKIGAFKERRRIIGIINKLYDKDLRLEDFIILFKDKLEEK